MEVLPGYINKKKTVHSKQKKKRGEKKKKRGWGCTPGEEERSGQLIYE
jgi:hypothetical protein